MPGFQVLAYSHEGEVVHKEIDATSEAQLVQKVENERLHLVHKAEVIPSRTSWVTPYQVEKIDFYRELALYLEKGVDIAERRADLSLIPEPGSSWARVVQSFLVSLDKKEVWQAMKEQPAAFSDAETSLMSSVVGADVPKNLRMLADFHQLMHRTMNKSWTTLIMPAFQFAGILLLMVIYLFNVIPAMRSMADDGVNKIPWQFEVLGNIHDWLLDPGHLWIIAAGFALAALGVWGLFRIGGFRNAVDAWFLRQPKGLGRIEYLRRLFQTYHILHLMLDSGREREALEAARNASMGPTFKSELDLAHKVNTRQIPPPDGQPSPMWADSLRFAPMVFDRKARALLKIAGNRGLLPAELNERKQYILEALHTEAERLPIRLQQRVTLFVGLILAFIVFFIVIPFGHFISNYH